MTVASAPNWSAELRFGAAGTPVVAVRPGTARIEIQSVAGQSAVTASLATSPMKLLTPRARGRSAWVYTSNFGGGLVAGDQTRLDLHVGKNARCFLGTQASTKVYRNPARLPCGHVTRATLAGDAIAIYAPDPVQPFADSTYAQRQEFQLATGAGLALVDWFTSGRAARGERWALHRFQSRNDVFISGERAFADSILLSSDQGSLASPHRAGRFNCFALLLLIGAPMAPFAATLLAELNQRPVERQAALVTSASPVRAGVLVRAAGESVEQVGHELHRLLKPLTLLLGDDPWARKW